MKPFPITLGMVVQNEEKLLPGCLEGVGPWVSEILLVDCGSRDATVKIAKRFGARVISHRWQEDFSWARNLYLEEARFPWILVLDAPERIALRDLTKLSRLTQGGRRIAYDFSIRNYSSTFNLLSGWHPNRGEYPQEERASQAYGWFFSRTIRLFPRSDRIRYEGFRHASVDASVWRAGFSIRPSRVPIHDVECLKGDRWIKAKQRRRLNWVLKALPGSSCCYETLLDAAKGLFCLGEENGRGVRYLRKALRIRPGSVEARQLLGMVLLTEGRALQAAAVLAEAVRRSPGNADLHCLAGIARLCGGNFSKAEGSLKKALALRADHPFAWNGLGQLLEAGGRSAQAVSAYRRAVILHPGYQEAKRNLDQLLRRGKDGCKGNGV